MTRILSLCTGYAGLDLAVEHRRERLFIVATPSDSNGSGLQERRHQGGLHPAITYPRSATHGGRGTSTPDPGSGQLARPTVENHGLLIPSERGRLTAADASGERHGRREDSRGLGRLDRPDEGSARERERSREVTGDRSAEAHSGPGCGPATRAEVFQGTWCACERPTPSDSSGNGRHEGWTKSAGLVGRPDGAERGSSPDFGQYAPAINRWATVLGRPAPTPTEPGAKGQPRLSPRFVEWMQGLPDGWVTDPAVGLTRNEMLKALGNGGVWQQAAAALTFLLKDWEMAA